MVNNQTTQLDNFLKLFNVLIRRRRIVISILFSLLFITLFYLLLVPSKYTAFSRILPPENSPSTNRLSVFAGQLSQIGGLPLNLNTSVLYKEIITSRPVILAVLRDSFLIVNTDKKLSLLDILNVVGENSQERFENGYEILVNSMIDVSLDISTNITRVEVTSIDPILSSEITKSLVEELDNFSRKFATQKAKESRIFIEDRLTSTQKLLEEAEELLKQFRDTNKRIENSPQLQLEQGRLIREIKIQEELFLTLKKELELTKIEEIKNIPLVRVLDEAIPPLRKSWPNRKGIAFVASIFAVITALIGAFTADFFSSIFSEEKVRISFKKMRNELKNDLRKVGSLFRKSIK